MVEKDNKGNGVSENIEIETKTMSALEAGYEKTVALAEQARKNWEEKKEEGGVLYRCKACGKTLKSEKAIKKHIEKTEECLKKKMGFEEVTDVVINNEDRKLSSDHDSIMEKMRKAREATQEIREDYANSRNPNGRKISVVDLNRCSPSGFESMLSRTDTDIIKKFVSQTFHPSNASRKYIAEKELIKRK